MMGFHVGKTRALCWSIGLMLVGAVGVRADAPSTQPGDAPSTAPSEDRGPADRVDRPRGERGVGWSDREDHGPGERGRPGDRPSRGPGGPGGPPRPQATTQEIEDASKFFAEHAPHKFEMYRALGEDRPIRFRLAEKMVGQYRRLEMVRAEDPELHSVLVKQMELQDEASFLLRQQRAKPDGVNQNELREKVRALVQLSLSERQKRIERLEKMLAEQKAKLEEDKGNPDALIDQHIIRMRTDLDELLEGFQGMDGPRRGRPPRER